MIALAATAGGNFAFAADRRALRIGVNGLPPSMEPINGISNTGPRIINQIFDTLIRRDYFADGAKETVSSLCRRLLKASIGLTISLFVSSFGKASNSTTAPR